MKALIIAIIGAIIGMAVVIPAVASERLKIGDYAIVMYIRRKGSTTEWKPGAKVEVIDVHIDEDIGVGVETDYTVLMENEDIAFPVEEQLKKAEE